MSISPERLFVEYDRVGPHGDVIASSVRRATEEDVVAAMALHDSGKCDHSIIYDIPGWMYDVRVCAICGTGLGCI